jgi:hypothetical protein
MLPAMEVEHDCVLALLNIAQPVPGDRRRRDAQLGAGALAVRPVEHVAVLV